MKRRDLRAELLVAEQEARDRKRKAEGKPALEPEAPKLAITSGDDDESNKRRKLLQEVIDLDKDDDSEDDEAGGSKPQAGADDEYVYQFLHQEKIRTR